MSSPRIHLESQLSSEKLKAIRERAEHQIANLPKLPSAKQLAQLPQSVQYLLHELQIHQIELEMQNEELRRMQTELDTARADYFDFYDFAPLGYCSVGEKGLIKQANLTAATMLGSPREMLLGQPFSHFVLREDQDVFYLFRRQLLDTREAGGRDLRLVQADGTAFWAHVAAIAAPDVDASTALRLVLSDITERKRTEAQLLLTASVFTHAREGIIVTDPQGTILEVNKAFTRITGFSRAEAMGNNPRILKSGRHDVDFYATLWNEMLREGYWSGEIWNRRKSGEIYVELLTISAVRDDQGLVQRYVALFSDISDFKVHEKELEHLAHFDALTNLPNRLLMADRLKLAMAQARRTGQGLALVYIDLDGFKTINDQHGHEAGDQVLIAVANQMHQVLREGDTLARLGGDEFVAILVNQSNVKGCAPWLDRLLAAVAQPKQFNDQMLQVSASLGVTFYPQEHEVDVEGDQLMRQADLAMYQAKSAGKNCYRVFDAKQSLSQRG